MTQLSFGTVAPTSRRAVAYIIDALIAAAIGIVLMIVLVVIGFAAGPDGLLAVVSLGAPVVWLLMLGWFVVYTWMQGGKGSIGMRAQGLRLAREADGAPLGFGKSLLRNIIFGLSASIVVGYFTPLFDGTGRFQGWHDKVAHSLMLDARGGAAAASSAPATQAMPVPPRPALPDGAPPVPDGRPAQFAPGFAGTLTTPQSAPQFAAPAQSTQAPTFPPAPYSNPAAPTEQAPALDETVRSVDALRQQPAASQTSAFPPAAAAPPAPIAHPAAPAPSEESLIAFVPGITQDGPPARSTPAPPAPAPAEPAAAEPVTQSSDDIEDTRISIPGHRLVFTWDDGTRVTVSQRTVFGRNPAPEVGVATVSVRDETLSLSKTHFEAAAEASGGWVMDRHSTNGTAIVRDGHRIVCPPGEQVRVRLGDAIEIGDRIVTIGGYA
ncbi:RDD family protein [Microbacterium sp. A196]|uniref:RDD family protein n=1 Tax=Microbacterium sp. A196 TaxID=3457320 RepID=UPI003FD1BE97